jgi:NAD(P)-dependent dehydrogenase (short-subunit alcohol dehydrogenase family)
VNVVVTGAAGGIGLEAARALVARGDRVIATARNAARCEDIRRELGDGVELVEMDMGSLASIRAGAQRVAELAPALDVLINNAGVLNTKKLLDTDGREMTWGVNVVAPFLLAELLVPVLSAAPSPRVVNVGSVAHRAGKLAWDDFEFEHRKYGGWQAYSQSKLALVLVTSEFARRHADIAANCVHPGGIATGIYRTVPKLFEGVLLRVLPSAAVGAVPLVYLATDPGLAGVTGQYFDKTIKATAAPAARSDADAARLYDLLVERTKLQNG